MTATRQTIESLRSLQGDYKYGFVTDIESDFAPKGLNEDTVRFISAKKEEPRWLLDWRLKAFSIWQQTREREPTWARVTYPKIDYQEIYYYAAPKRIPSCSGPTKSSVSRLGNARRSPGSRWMPCSTRSPSPPLSKGGSRSWASSSARFPRLYASIRNWCAGTSAASCHTATTSLRR